MSKVAALGPFLAANAVPLALTAAGVIGEGMAQRKTQREQDDINRQWLEMQERKKATFEESNADRIAANQQSLAEYLSGADETSRMDVVADEEARLFDRGTENIPLVPDSLAGDELIAGAKFGSKNFKDFAGKKLAEATQEARDRIKALAKTNAYGGSFGGLALDRGLAGRTASQDIGFENEMGMVDLGTLNRWQTVEPERLEYESTGLGSLLTTLGGNMMGAPVYAPMSSPRPRPRPVR